MLKSTFKTINKNKTVLELRQKYNISKEYTSIKKQMIARGVLIGLFIAFIPMPMQMGAVILFTVIGKFNLPIALVLCWITNPFTMPFIYFLEYSTGSFFLGCETLDVSLSIDWFNANIEKIVFPLYAGALFYSVTISSIAYCVIIKYWKRPIKNKIKQENI